MKTYKHKQTGWIVKEQAFGYDATQPNTLITTIPKELVEDSLDRELQKEKDWMQLAREKFALSTQKFHNNKEFKEAIEKYMPKITREDIYSSGCISLEGMADFLKEKGLLKE